MTDTVFKTFYNSLNNLFNMLWCLFSMPKVQIIGKSKPLENKTIISVLIPDLGRSPVSLVCWQNILGLLYPRYYIIVSQNYVLIAGKYSCSLILMNEDIGEFLYTVEAKAVYPQVSALPFKPGPNSVRISSAAAASKCGKQVLQ